MNVMVVISQMVQLFLILGIGYAAVKAKIINREFGTKLSNFVVEITLPCLMLASLASVPESIQKSDVWMMVVVSALYYLIMPFIAYAISRLLMVKKEERRLYTYMSIWSNVGFMGFPVIASIFGEGALFFVTIFNLFFNLSNYTLGVILMQKEGTGRPDIKKFFSFGMVSALLAFVLFLADIKLPTILNDTMKMIGSATTPLAMVVIGIALTGISFRRIFSEFRLYPFLVIKQIVLPLLVWLLLKNIILNPFLLGIIIIITAMPVATTTVLFANRFDNHLELATKGVFITTLASVVTIPLIAYFLSQGY